MGHHSDTNAGSSWRNGHPTVFLSGCVIIALCDIAFAVFVLVYSYETPAYVYIQAAVWAILEASYIALSLTLIEMHKFTRSHKDMGALLVPFWCANLSIDISYFIGASAKIDTSDATFIAGAFMAGLSQVSGIALIIWSQILHIFSLYDPNPHTHGFHLRRKHRRKPTRDDSETDDDDDEK